MDYFRVKNWERFQHYKHRNPTWIKLHTALADDYEYASLPDVTKALYVGILVLAARTGNRIPNDPIWIQQRAGLREPVDLTPLLSIGYLIDSKPLAACSGNGDSEREERKKEGLKTSPRKSIREEGLRAISGDLTMIRRDP